MNRYQQEMEELTALGKYLQSHGLNWGTAGNLSVKTGEQTFLLTASVADLAALEADDFVELTLSGEKVAGDKKPSKEIKLHQYIYQERPEIRSVIHASPFYSTLLSAVDLEVPHNWFVEAMYYLERIERVPYAHPGSNKLAEMVRAKARATNIIMLANHGVLVYGQSVMEAKTALTTLEVACRMLVEARRAGLEVKALSDATVSDFLEHSGYRLRRIWTP